MSPKLKNYPTQMKMNRFYKTILGVVVIVPTLLYLMVMFILSVGAMVCVGETKGTRLTIIFTNPAFSLLNYCFPKLS